MAGPRRFNWFTAVLVLAFAGAGYWLWKFFPVYYEGYQVDQILGNGAAKAYKVSHYNEPLRTRSERELVDGMRGKIVALGVSDPELTVSMRYEGNEVITFCDYTVIVRHPVAGKQTKVVMHRQKKADLTRTNWD